MSNYIKKKLNNNAFDFLIDIQWGPKVWDLCKTWDQEWSKEHLVLQWKQNMYTSQMINVKKITLISNWELAILNMFIITFHSILIWSKLILKLVWNDILNSTCQCGPRLLHSIVKLCSYNNIFCIFINRKDDNVYYNHDNDNVYSYWSVCYL